VLRALRLGTPAALPRLWAFQFSTGPVLFRVRCRSRSGQAVVGAVDSASCTGRPGVLGERRQLAIMVCDMVGSCALSTRLDPEEQSDVIHTCCANEVKSPGGMVAQSHRASRRPALRLYRFGVAEMAFAASPVPWGPPCFIGAANWVGSRRQRAAQGLSSFHDGARQRWFARWVYRSKNRPCWLEDGPIVSAIFQLKPLTQGSRCHTELALKSAPESAFRSEASLPGDLSQLQLRRLQERAGKFTPDLLDCLCGCRT